MVHRALTAQLIQAARNFEPAWYAATLLAGEAGLRIGEIMALRWGFIDTRANRLTVARQVRRGKEGTPKGRTRRTVPMTEPLAAAIAALPLPHHGKLLRHPDCSYVTEGEAKHVIYDICEAANLPNRGWHALRHSMATHAARLGVNPWTLQRWLGHKRIDETMRYVHLIEEHPRPIPSAILQAGQDIADPDHKILVQLGARLHR